MTIGRGRLRPGALLALALCACAHTLPSPLALPPAADDADAHPILTRADALAAVLDGDPLARRTGRLSGLALSGVEGAASIAAALDTLASLESSRADVTVALHVGEHERPGTESVAIFRGYRLALAERSIASSVTAGTPLEFDVASLLAPLAPEERPTAIGRHPLAWLAPDTAGLPDALYTYAERWVLQAWLDGPSIPVGPVAALLHADAYDTLALGPTGRLLQARADGLRADATAALADLDRATQLALTRAAADRDGEQTEWRALRKAAADELGVDDPVSALLQRAATGLTADAGNPRSAGAALLAIAADRLDGTCPDAPCIGLDRTSLITRAGAWDASLQSRARVWRVIALKDALDAMEAGHETVRFNPSLVDLVDALTGTGAFEPPASLLSRRTADEPAWSQIGAMVGDASPKTWVDVRRVVGLQLARETSSALEISDQPSRPLIERIARRSHP